jgi:chemotaxis protein CheX
MTHERLVAMTRTAAHEVFDTMLGIHLVELEAFVHSSAPGPSEGVLALIGLAGQWAGTGTFSCAAESAQRISGALLMQEYSSVDEDVLDAIGEVTNMVLGNVKTALEEELGPMGLSIPTVIYGRNFTTRSVGKSQWSVVPFECEGQRVEIQICLAPARDLGGHATAKERLTAVLQMLE